MIYFDNNATTPMASEVQDCYAETLAVFGNSSSVHAAGQQARRLLNESRESIAESLKVSESTLTFTSGGTESLNAAIIGQFLPDPSGKHLIVSAVEHAAVLATARFLAEMGVEVTYLSVDRQARLDLAELAAAIRPETQMIAVMFANNELGNLYPVKEIGELARERGVLYLCDAVQVAGKLPLDLSRLPIDLMAVSAHKFHGPKGTGFLYAREGIELTPWLHGGRQERGHRAGTEGLPGIVAMAKAWSLAGDSMLKQCLKIKELRDMLQAKLCQAIPDTHILGDLEHRLDNTLNLWIPEVSGEAMLMNLDLAGLAMSIGSACESGSVEPSHVLQAMGLPDKVASSGLRFSLSRFNTAAEVDQAVKIITQVVAKIRA